MGVSIMGARVARADGLPGGATITFSRFSIKEGGSFKEPDQDGRRKFLNLAHCICAKANAPDVSEFQYDLKLSADINTSAPGDIWVGSQCDGDATARMTSCLQLTDKGIADVRTLVNPQKLTLNLYDVINGKDSKDHMAACVQREGPSYVYLLVDTPPGLPYEYAAFQAVGEVTMNDKITVDTKPPEPVSDLSVEGSEKAIEIKWTPSANRNTDYYYYQALCANVDDTPVFDPGKLTPQYQTAKDLCGQTGDFTLTKTPIDLPGEDPVDTAPAAFSSLDPAFLCGDQAGGTSRSLKIEGLKNGTKYKVALLAIDYHGNVTATYFNSTVTPQPVTDFWEDLNDRNSAIDGGCLLSKTYGDGNPLTQTLRAFRDETLARTAYGRWLIDVYYATLGRLAVESLPARIAAGIALGPLVALALLWHLLTLPGLLAVLALPWLWRRRAALLRAR
ncbi:MAG TPA: hypothetical protein VN253_27725, partial [Kofleriaceae bacterium]|nr:hypothetical protein [Kofleriaceae bacterium]